MEKSAKSAPKANAGRQGKLAAALKRNMARRKSAARGRPAGQDHKAAAPAGSDAS